MIAPPRPQAQENSLSLLSNSTTSALSSIKSCKLSSPQFLNTHAPFIKTEFPSNNSYPNIVQQMKMKMAILDKSHQISNSIEMKTSIGTPQDIAAQAASIQNLLLESLKNKQNLKRKSNNKSPHDVAKMKKKN